MAKYHSIFIWYLLKKSGEAGCFLRAKPAKNTPYPTLLRCYFICIIFFLLVGCSSTTGAEPDPVFTNAELALITAFSEQSGLDFYTKRSECVRDVERGSTEHCLFAVGVETLQQAELQELFPATTFYLIDIGSWRSDKNLAAHETQSSPLSRMAVAWQDEKIYFLKDINLLLKANGTTITDSNRETVARSIALLSIPNYLGGEVHFSEWLPVEPGNYRQNYTHSLQAWTQVWGCDISWWYVFKGAGIKVATIRGNECRSNEYGDYLKDNQYFGLGDEGVLIGVPPSLQDYYFNP